MSVLRTKQILKNRIIVKTVICAPHIRLEREDLWYSNLVTDLDEGGAEVLLEEWRNGQDLPCQYFPLE